MAPRVKLKLDSRGVAPRRIGREVTHATTWSDNSREKKFVTGVAPRVKLNLDSLGVAPVPRDDEDITPRCGRGLDTNVTWKDDSLGEEHGVRVAPRVKLSLASLFVPQEESEAVKGSVEKGAVGVGDDSAPVLQDSVSVATC